MDAVPTLKCVVAWSERRNLCTLVAGALRARVDAKHVRSLCEDVCLLYTTASPSEIRDWLRDVVERGESALVMEFEKWSGWGPGVDSEWLLRRGH
jgi:hypothetical protein